MAYEDIEESVESGQPVELYVLALGTSIWRMHNSIDDEISYGGDTYYPSEISRGKLLGDGAKVEITLPGSHDFPLNFVTIAPGQRGTLTVFRYHRGEAGSVKVIFKGIAISIAFTDKGLKSKIVLKTVTNAFDKTIPDRTYQAGCNNVLFDTNCQVDPSLHKHLGVVTDVTNNTITVDGLSVKGDGWSKGSYVSIGSYDYRLILGQTGSVLTLVLPFHESPLGSEVAVYAGCSHTIGVCNSKFNNKDNFGGCPYVPTKNVFTSGLE